MVNCKNCSAASTAAATKRLPNYLGWGLGNPLRWHPTRCAGGTLATVAQMKPTSSRAIAA